MVGTDSHKGAFSRKGWADRSTSIRSSITQRARTRCSMKRGIEKAPKAVVEEHLLLSHTYCTAIVTVLEVLPPIVMTTATVPPAGASAGTWAFTW